MLYDIVDLYNPWTENITEHKYSNGKFVSVIDQTPLY
jgi:hypothetical protein